MNVPFEQSRHLAFDTITSYLTLVRGVMFNFKTRYRELKSEETTDCLSGLRWSSRAIISSRQSAVILLKLLQCFLALTATDASVIHSSARDLHRAKHLRSSVVISHFRRNLLSHGTSFEKRGVCVKTGWNRLGPTEA